MDERVIVSFLYKATLPSFLSDKMEQPPESLNVRRTARTDQKRQGK